MKAAWSLHRRLLASYTGALVRVRRSGDNSEYDFNPKADGTLDVAAVEAFCMAGGGAHHGHVVKVYDQSGNGLDMFQTTAGAQMRLVESGVMHTSGTGLYPSMKPFDGSQLYCTNTFSPNYTGEKAWLFTHQNMGNTADVWNSVSLSRDTENNWDSSERAVFFSMSAGNFDAVRNGVHSTGFAAATGMMLLSVYFDGTGWYYNDGSSGGSDSSTDMQGAFNVNRFLLAAYSPSSAYGGTTCNFTEAVVYLSDMAADEGGIRTAMALNL
jgi:hypothetical protein